MNDFDAIVAAVKASRRILISSHVNPDGDSIGSQLALYHLLRALDKEVQVINHDPVPATLRFLPGADEVLPPGGISGSYEATFLLDCGQSDRSGSVVAEKSSRFGRIINIDHHATSAPWADLNWIDQASSSTAEMIHRLTVALLGKPDLDMACCIYTGIISDTGSFRHSNTTSRALNLAASLVELGVDPSQVAFHLFQNMPYETLKLLGLVLGTLRMTPDGLVSWIVITREHLRDAGTNWEATEDFINYPRSVPSVIVAMCFKDISDGVVKVSFRSRGRVDVARIALRHGGGGHLNAAGCNMSGGIEETVEKMTREVHRELAHYQIKSHQHSGG